MGHAHHPDKLLEVASDKLWAIVGDDPGAGLGEGLAGALEDDFHVGLGHLGAELPVHEESAEAIEHRAQVEEGAEHIEVGNIHMPVLMGGPRAAGSRGPFWKVDGTRIVAVRPA